MIRIHLSFVLWLTGKPERALRFAQEVSTLGASEQHPATQLCHVIWSELPISLWSEDQAGFTAATAKFRSCLKRVNLPVSHPAACFYQAIADHRDGDRGAVSAMRRALDKMVNSGHVVRAPLYFAMLAEALLQDCHFAEARTTIDHALGLAHQHGEIWSDPELIRISAAVDLAAGDLWRAVGTLREARRIAIGTGALFFALRAASDLAEIHLREQRPLMAVQGLQPIYSAFTEGFGSHALVRAAQLLAEACISPHALRGAGGN